MPIVLRSNAFRIVILLPPREHGPPHVHVRSPGGEVVIQLEPVHVRTVHRMRSVDVLNAVRLVESHLPHLLAEWRRYHG